MTKSIREQLFDAMGAHPYPELTTKARKSAVNDLAAELLSVLDQFPDYLIGDKLGWTYTNALWHARECARATITQYIKHCGNREKFKAAKARKPITARLPKTALCK